MLAAFLLACSYVPKTYGAEDGGNTVDKISVDYMGLSEGYAAVLYDNQNGLPTSEANAIVETAEGSLWIGSYSGLIRYDGSTFERMDSTSGIASVVSLYVDSKNRLWIGTNDSGLAMIYRDEETHYKKAEGLNSASVHAITEDAKGNVYVGTMIGMAIVDASGEMRAIDEPQINREAIRELWTGIDGKIYGLTMDGAIFTMENGKMTGYYDGTVISTSSVHALYPDPKKPGYVYLGTSDSVCYGKLESTGWKEEYQVNISPLSGVNDVKCIQDQLWICTDNGIGIIENGKCKKLDNIPLEFSIENLLVDYQGNLWFTSSRQGVMKIVPDQFMDVFERFHLPNTVVNSTCYLDGLLYAGTDNGLFVMSKDKVYDKLPLKSARTASGKEWEATDLIKLYEGGRIRSIIRDGKDRLWISSFSKEHALVCYDHGAATVYGPEDGLPFEKVRAVAEKENGGMLVACSGGVAVIEGDQVKEVYGEENGLSNTEVLTVAEGPNGDIVLGTNGDGIYVIRNKTWTRVGLEEGLESGVVMRIRRDAKRKLFWIVTSNSIAFMNENYELTTIRQFPYSNNFDVICNSGGDCWVLSSNGIYVVAADELLANGEIHPRYYSRDNGLSCVPTANSYSDVTADGDLYVAGSTGVVKVNVDKPFGSMEQVKMAVPFVEADGVKIYPNEDGAFTIPSSTKKLTIHAYAYVYTLMNPQITYYLKGFDHEKRVVSRSDLGEVDYTNLSGGEYSFIIQLHDSASQGESELTVKILKKSALYEYWWFKMLCLVLFVFLIVKIALSFVQKQTKALMKKQEENKQLIREITEAFAMTIDMKDRYTRGHSTRVAEYTAMLARELGYDEETVEKYRNIALLHDIGKIGVPPEVLNKQGKLTDQEFAVIKSHSALGYEALRKINIMPELAIGARSHHERPDGKGYPQGLTQDDIPRVAQIIAVADTFDAMYSDRPYRKRMNFDKAVSIIREVAGTQLTSDVVDAFLRLVEKGEFRAADDVGGGSMEDINNIHKKQEKQAEEERKAEEAKAAEETKSEEK